MAASKGAQPKTIDVLPEDQDRINTFSRLHTKMRDLEAQLRVMKKSLEELEDASNELMLSDEETVRFLVGECLVHFDKDTAEARLETHTQQVHKDVKETTAELEEINEKIKQLKAVLYAKFGNSINLDD